MSPESILIPFIRPAYRPTHIPINHWGESLLYRAAKAQGEPQPIIITSSRGAWLLGELTTLWRVLHGVYIVCRPFPLRWDKWRNIGPMSLKASLRYLNGNVVWNFLWFKHEKRNIKWTLRIIITLKEMRLNYCLCDLVSTSLPSSIY